MASDLDIARQAAMAGAEIVRREFGQPVDAEFKGDGNPVTEVDRRAEAAILAVIQRLAPDDQVLSEEAGGGGWDGERIWIVDPVDGTVNFIHRIPQVSVSVALWDRGSPRVGVVVDPLRGELFEAAAGRGASSKGQPMAVSTQVDLKMSLIATGFPYDRDRFAAGYASNLGGVLASVQGVRRLGSAALDLAWLACGRYEGYWEFGIQPWDAAAGVLIVIEAGGQVTNHLGGPHRLDDPGLIASNGAIHPLLVEAVSRHLPEHVR
ncbi:MAG TPA: inositol monophosphatase family protein [Acidimicrobiia bacterium]